MKLAFTTLGCLEWDLPTIISKATEFGFDGVDFRGYLGELDIYKLPEFSSGIADSAKRFADAGLDVPCLSSSALVCPKPDVALDEIRAYAPMCEALGSSFIRVFGGGIGEASRDEAVETTAETLRQLGAIAADHGAVVLVETHDSWTNSSYVAALMEATDSDSVAVLWDTHHPFRTTGEDPQTTWNNVGRWTRYTHWKDSYVSAENKRGYQLCMMGDGDVPHAEIYGLLNAGDYDGYLTLEWERKWCPELEDADAAFPQYVAYMRGLMGA